MEKKIQARKLGIKKEKGKKGIGYKGREKNFK